MLVTSKGLGLDIWFVEEDNIHTFLILIFASELSYAIALALVKLSILAFFLRIFPDQKFRTVVRWTTIFILVMCSIYLSHDRQFRSHPNSDSIFNITQRNH
nr:hypothetical protein FVER53263_20775 [Fusarium verticillioides]